MELTPGPDPAVSAVQQVVCLGSSAGGLEALGSLLRSLPADLPFCYVVAQHLSPTHASPLPHLLSRETTLVVRLAEDGAALEAGVALVAPPNADITVGAATVHVRSPGRSPGPSPDIDGLLRSAAESWGELAVAIVLSGTGRDGSDGVVAVRAAGGVSIAQEPGSARFPGMPESAIGTGAVDVVLPPGRIGAALQRLASGGGLPDVDGDDSPPVPASPFGEASWPEAVTGITSVLQAVTGVDFAGYKEATLRRRIQRRMAVLRVPELSRYHALVAESPSEARELTSALLVTVTSFFRDPMAWRALDTPLRALLGRLGDQVQVRLWVPGCATGEEAYTLGMIVAELLGQPGDLARRMKIFATDLDQDALRVARAGLYTDDAVQTIPREARDRWLRHSRGGWQIAPDLRDCMVFARHNVALDPPFPKIHLISLRNTLIYFESALQERVLRLLHFSLTANGLLLLGESERVNQNHSLFETIDPKNRVYLRRSSGADGVLPTPQPRPAGSMSRRQVPASRGAQRRTWLRDSLIRSLAPPSLVVDDQDDVIEVIGEVSRWCWVAEGHHSSHVVALVRDELRPVVRSLLLTVRQGAIERAERSITTSGGAVVVSVCRLDDRAAAAGEPGSGAMVVSFVEPPPPVARSGTGPPGSGDPDVARMLRELASTEAALQATIEQLSITNEEFQALNEELQAASEELQASNEEVHASNEELEATNEELSSLNLELEHRGSALATANADLENIQASLTSGLVLLDRDLRITRYTPLAVRLFALIATDVGRPLTAIPSTIEIPDLELRLREAVEEKKDGLLELHGDRNDVLLHFHPYRGRDGAVLGAILVSTDISDLAAAHRAAERSLRDLVAVTDALREAVWQRTEDGRLLFMNSQVEHLFGLNRRHVIEDPHLMLAAVHPEDRERVAMAAAAHPAEPYSIEYRIVRRGQVRWVHEAAVVVPPDGSGAGYIVASALDVTDTHQVEERAGEHLETLEAVFHNTVFGVLVLDAEDRVVRANDRIVRMSGYDHASLVGMPVRLVIQDTQPLDPFADVEIAPDPTAPLTLGIAHRRLVGRNGLPYFVTMEIRQLSSGDGGARIVIVHDVTRLHEANLELAARALFDQNTGLLVRSYFREQLSRELARSDRSGAGLAVLWIDLDGFKAVNDRYGHQAGDIVLREVARRLQHASRRQDAVGRLGGDEFAMLVTDIDQADGLEAVAQRVLAVLREPIRLSDSQVYLSGSMGVAVAPEDGDDPDALLHSADTAMYAAKQAGHDRRVYFRADLNHAAEKRAGTRHDLAVAMRARQFVMHYQPVISTATGEVCSVEALIRWTREDGIVPAADFMAVAEQTGQLRAIGRIALDLIDEDLHTLRAEPGYEQLPVCVNLSPAQLEERDLLDWLVAWEPDGGFDRLVIEVTEAAALARGGRPVETLTLLRKLGARLSIDDFGTGYSNLALLDRLRPSIIKIDRTLLSRAENQSRGLAVLKAAVQLVHALDAQVVVEGVENEQLWRLACSLGAEQMQGFHLARPMSLPDLIGWIGRHGAGISGSG